MKLQEASKLIWDKTMIIKCKSFRSAEFIDTGGWPLNWRMTSQLVFVHRWSVNTISHVKLHIKAYDWSNKTCGLSMQMVSQSRWFIKTCGLSKQVVSQSRLILKTGAKVVIVLDHTISCCLPVTMVTVMVMLCVVTLTPYHVAMVMLCVFTLTPYHVAMVMLCVFTLTPYHVVPTCNSDGNALCFHSQLGNGRFKLKLPITAVFSSDRS